MREFCFHEFAKCWLVTSSLVIIVSNLKKVWLASTVLRKQLKIFQIFRRNEHVVLVFQKYPLTPAWVPCHCLSLLTGTEKGKVRTLVYDSHGCFGLIPNMISRLQTAFLSWRCVVTATVLWGRAEQTGCWGEAVVATVNEWERPIFNPLDPQPVFNNKRHVPRWLHVISPAVAALQPWPTLNTSCLCKPKASGEHDEMKQKKLS